MRVRHLFLLIAALLLTSGCAKSNAQNHFLNEWDNSKFSMFIHYGLYSQLGGVWMGKPVTEGYSEQIQSFGVRFSDWYAQTAQDFNPDNWDADAIVGLARQAGMRSIVFTAKHHDGFCMFDTQTTDYNVVKATPTGRDVMSELSNACAQNGINFGIYFSLIDWHFPPAMPISSHNADSIPPEHHQYNLRQVKEILTRYGNISELWFDMGSLTPAQSKELYELVHRLQPQCLVSGRLGNGYHDFSVMPDNQLPESPLVKRWQTAASIYPETWGYRSWQKHIPQVNKVNEKITDLVRVVARGGNYLLNIGPKGDGSVTAYEKGVLTGIGAWLKQYGAAIYGTTPTPFAQALPWGECTQKANELYLFIDPKYSGKWIEIPAWERHIQKIAPFETPTFACTIRHQQGATLCRVPDSQQSPWIVLRASLASHTNSTQAIAARLLPPNSLLSPANATVGWAHTLGDYYTGRNIAVHFRWNVSQSPIQIYYTQDEVGQSYRLTTAEGKSEVIKLKGTLLAQTKTIRTPWSKIHLRKAYIRQAGGVLGVIPKQIAEEKNFDPNKWLPAFGAIAPVIKGELTALYYVQDIDCDEDIELPVKLGFNNGVHLLLNGHQHFTAFDRQTNRILYRNVLLPLRRGRNRLVIKYFNRFNPGDLNYKISFLDSYTRYRQSIHPDKTNRITLEHVTEPFPLTDLNASNIRFK